MYINWTIELHVVSQVLITVTFFKCTRSWKLFLAWHVFYIYFNFCNLLLTTFMYEISGCLLSSYIGSTKKNVAEIINDVCRQFVMRQICYLCKTVQIGQFKIGIAESLEFFKEIR